MASELPRVGYGVVVDVSTPAGREEADRLLGAGNASSAPQGQPKVWATPTLKVGADGFSIGQVRAAPKLPAEPSEPTKLRERFFEVLEGRERTMLSPSDKWVESEGKKPVGRIVLNPHQQRNGTLRTLLEAVAVSPLVNEALKALAPAEQARFKALETALHSSAVASASLIALLLKGTLAGERGSELLKQLERMRTADVSALMAQHSKPLELNQTSVVAHLLRSTVSELAVRELVSQGRRGTCAVAVVIGEFSLLRPEVYARLVADLAIHGRGQLPNGARVKTEPDVLIDGSGRSLAQLLLQPAFKQYSSPLWRYDNTRGASTLLFMTKQGDGTEPEESKRVADALFGVEFESVDDRSKAAANVLEALEARRFPIFASVQLGERHLMAIDRLVETAEGKFIEAYDPNGYLVHIALDTFENIVVRSMIPTAAAGPGR